MIFFPNNFKDCKISVSTPVCYRTVILAVPCLCVEYPWSSSRIINGLLLMLRMSNGGT